MKLSVLDKNGKKIEDIELDKGVFGQKENTDLLAQYIHVYNTNLRQGTSKVKTRAEVRGGGRKPWRQKGTGRARHGSIRSPIWVKGGIAHGPKTKEYKLKLPKKMKKRAMQCALSFKAKNGEVKVIDQFKLGKPSTKSMKNILDKTKLSKKALLVTDKADQNVLKSISNIPYARAVFVDSLNVYDLLDAKDVMFEKSALLNLQKKYK